MQIRRSAKIKRSGFLHTRNSGKTDGTVSNQWRIGMRDGKHIKIKSDISIMKEQ